MSTPHSSRETYRQVIHLAYPVVFSTLATTVMGVTDTLLMGWVSTAAQGGVGLGAILSWTVSSFFIGTLTVITTFTAQHVGAKQPGRCGAVVWQGLLLSAAFSLVVELGARQVPHLVALFGAEPAVADIAARYAVIRVVAMPLSLVEASITSFMRGVGDTRTPMKVSFGMVVLNVPLNLWLVFGGLGVAPLGPMGSAFATVIAIGAGVVVLLLLFLRRSMRLTYRTWGPGVVVAPARQVADLLRVGLPIGVGWVLEMGTWLIFSAFVSSLGAQPLAAHNIVMQVLHVSFMPGVAISVAATTLVGQHIGAVDPEAAERSGYAALKVAMIYMGCMGLTFLLFGGLIASAFSRDPEVLHIARRLFLFAAAFQLFDAMGMVSGGILRGAGDTRFPMAATVVCSWLLFVPLVWLVGFRLRGGVLGSWTGATVYIIVLGIVMLWRVRSGTWKSYSVTRP
jgi:multidrug resistance protein, MATE family